MTSGARNLKILAMVADRRSGWDPVSFASAGGVCEPECPVDAIKPDTDPGLVKWLSLNAEYAKIWPNIKVKKEPPPDWKEWEGKPDKFQYFSPNPGAGD
jgi:hypothetical protein